MITVTLIYSVMNVHLMVSTEKSHGMFLQLFKSFRDYKLFKIPNHKWYSEGCSFSVTLLVV